MAVTTTRKKDSATAGILATARGRYDSYVSTFQDNRLQCLQDIRYYHGNQLSRTMKQELHDRGQPEVIVNRVRVAINGIVGVIARSQTDPKATPRTPDDDVDASLATDCLRYCADKNKLDKMKGRLLEDMLIPGTAAVIVEMDENGDVKVRRIRWEDYFIDTRSREEDGSDKEYDGICKWYYVNRAKKMWPDHAEALGSYIGDDTGIAGVTDEASEDRPNNDQMWYDKKSRRVRITEMYYLEDGDWWRIVFFGGGVLEHDKSAYVDEHGRTRNPIECVSSYVDDQNQRYGHVRDMRSIQDEINKRRSKLLHLANSSQIEARDVTAIEVDAATARKEAARPDGVIPYGWQRVRTTDMSAGQSALLSEAKNEIERFSPNPAVLGRQGADTSGRALLARQQAGLVELARLLDDFDDFEVRIYRAMWLCMKQFWDEPKWIRVTKDEESARFFQINKPLTEKYVGVDENGMAAVQERVLGYENQIGALDVDITIESQAETATIMAEQIDKLMEMVARNPEYQGKVPFEIFLELMPLPRKHQIIKKVKEYQAQQAEQQAAQAEEQKQVALSREQLEQEKIESETDLNKAKAEEIGFRASMEMTQNVADYIARNRPDAGGTKTGQTAA